MKFSRKTVKIGTFTLILTAIVLAVIIALNLLASELPASVKSIDTTKEKLYTIGDETKAVLKDIKNEVQIYLFVEKGQETNNTMTLEVLLEQYAGENDNISYKIIDPADNPNFSKQYTEETIVSDSVIVVSGNKNRVINGSEWTMFETAEGRLTSEQYNNMAMMYSYYNQTLEAVKLFMGETNLTSAIAYVTSENTDKVYTLTGHGETEISDGYTEIVTSSNVDLESLNLLTGDGTIPEDCTILIINYPSQDITEKELDTISDYYANGGSVILVTTINYIDQNKEPNLISLAARAGMQPQEGVIFEGDPSGYQSYPLYLIPSVSPSAPGSLISEGALTYYMPASHGIEEKEGTGAVFTPILVTSDSSYLKTDIYNIDHFEKDDTDAEGPFTVAALSTLDNGDTTSSFFWFASPAYFDKKADFGGNSSLFKSILSSCSNGAVTTSVEPKTISTTTLTVNESQAGAWRTVFIAVIPLVILAAGFVVWIVRRKKR